MKYILPRGYLSHTQVQLFKKSPTDYVRRYLEGEKVEMNGYMELGHYIAEELEKKKSKDSAIEHIRLLTPNYSRREHEIKVGGTIPLLIKMDACDLPPKTLRLGEYKSTTKIWTQKKVDADPQITFYNLVLYKKYKKFPKETLLHCAETKFDENDNLYLTGRVETFITKRTLRQVLSFEAELHRVAKGITELVKKHRKNP